MRIDTVLTNLGVGIIAVGMLWGIISLAMVDWSAYNHAKEILAIDPSDMGYVAERALYSSKITAAITSMIGGVIAGVMFIGFAAVIESLQASEQTNREMRDALNKMNRNQASS